jgi:hypothetical protein
MQRQKRLLLGIATGLLIAVSCGNAKADDHGEGHTRPYKGTFAGTSLTSRIDLNNDGSLAGWSTSVVNTNLGKSTNEGVVERRFVAAPGVCAAGQVELGLVQGKGVSTFLSTGDQIFGETTSSTFCYDPATGNYSGHDTGIVTGGTGKFEGATGSIERSYTGTDLVIDRDPASKQAFGRFSGEFSGTITLP